MEEKLREAIEPYRPAVVEEYKRLVNHQFETMVRNFGPALHGVYNGNLALPFRQQIAPNLVTSQSTNFHIQRKEPKSLDPAKLDKNVEKYAKG